MNTRTYLQARIDYINHQLTSDLNSKIELRRQYVEELMLKKHQVLETYNNLFAPIVKFIQDYHSFLIERTELHNSSHR